MASMATRTRADDATPHYRSPGSYLAHDIKICFKPSLFSLVVASAQTATSTRDMAFADKNARLHSALWASATETRKRIFAEDVWLADTPTQGDAICVRLPRFLPLTCPCPLPVALDRTGPCQASARRFPPLPIWPWHAGY
jgi:hypothetical protein